LEGALLRKDVVIKELGQGDGLEEQHIALERAEVDSTANIECADVSAEHRIRRMWFRFISVQRTITTVITIRVHVECSLMVANRC
jgi:hypothetical protein